MIILCNCVTVRSAKNRTTLAKVSIEIKWYIFMDHSYNIMHILLVL